MSNDATAPTFETLLDLFYGDPIDAEEFASVTAAEEACPDAKDEAAYWGYICARAITDEDLHSLIVVMRVNGQPAETIARVEAALAGDMLVRAQLAVELASNRAG